MFPTLFLKKNHFFLKKHIFFTGLQVMRWSADTKSTFLHVLEVACVMPPTFGTQPTNRLFLRALAYIFWVCFAKLASNPRSKMKNVYKADPILLTVKLPEHGKPCNLGNCEFKNHATIITILVADIPNSAVWH